MSILNQIARLVKDPPPSHLFELSSEGIAFAHGSNSGFQPLDPGVLVPSPVEDNLLRSDLILSALQKVAPANGSSKKRRPAAVVLPDYAARVTVLDFDSFPTAPDEQMSLVRFRVKKTVPFDIDSAAVSFHVQPPTSTGAAKKIEVVSVMVALEVMARYEALFRNAGFHPGVITTSTLAALNLYHGEGVAVLAKLVDRVLTVTVLSGQTIKLFRCVTLEEVSESEMLGVLYPTLAYVEDELNSPARKLILCGFPPGALANVHCELDVLRSRFGVPGAMNAGLLGYMEEVEG